MPMTDEPLTIGGETIEPGCTVDLRLKVSESYFGDPISIPIRVHAASRPGPVVFITAAIHGDEINGTGILGRFLQRYASELQSGTIVAAPVVNVFGFERQERDLPDRRDLNRAFPGADDGSLAARLARLVVDEIVSKCDYGIDLHSAGALRTNFPNVRGDLKNPEVRRLARAFGCELVVDGRGPTGSLRRYATDSGCPTIILEAGEVQKFEPAVVETGVGGIRNALIELGMMDGVPLRPLFQTTVRRTVWLRSDAGGLLRFHVALGEVVDAGQPIASCETAMGEANSVTFSFEPGIVMGLATNPAVKPGEPICHLAIPRKRLDTIKAALADTGRDHFAHKLRAALSHGHEHWMD